MTLNQPIRLYWTNPSIFVSPVFVVVWTENYAVDEDCNCTCELLSERCKFCNSYIYEKLSMYSFICTYSYIYMELVGFAKLLIQKLNLTI